MLRAKGLKIKDLGGVEIWGRAGEGSYVMTGERGRAYDKTGYLDEWKRTKEER